MNDQDERELQIALQQIQDQVATGELTCTRCGKQIDPEEAWTWGASGLDENGLVELEWLHCAWHSRPWRERLRERLHRLRNT